MIKRAFILFSVASVIVAAGFGIARGLRAAISALADVEDSAVPTTTVRRADVSIEVTARGELQGGGARGAGHA